jgi:heme/copper-type cytochrome/quinol oxidase subunit 1
MGSSQFINQEILMCYLVNVDHKDMAVQWMILMIISYGMAMKRMGMLRASARKMKALTVKLETVTLIGKGR